MAKNETDGLAHLRKQIGNVPLLSKEQEVALARRIQAGDLDARNELVESNIRLVFFVARNYIGMPMEDLIQEGSLGLLRAAEKFDPGKGAGFATYALPWIKQAIHRALETKATTIRVPSNQVEKLYRLNRERDRIANETGREVSFEEAAIEAGISTKYLDRVLRARQVDSLDALSVDGEEDSPEVANAVPDLQADRMFEAIIEDAGSEESLGIMFDRAKLTDREITVLSLRYGLLNGREMTFEEVGNTLGYSRQAAQDTERRAFKKLRKAAS